MISCILLLLLVQSSWSYIDDTYPSDNLDAYLYPDDLSDDYEISKRGASSNHFLRFGRSGSKGEEERYDEYPEDFARPTRSGRLEKNDHFIRFGRTPQDFLRFGREPHRTSMNRRIARANHLRFGRSIDDSTKHRSKRDTYSNDDFKRASKTNYLRFGRTGNSNFMRFGRNEEKTNNAHVFPVEVGLRASPLMLLLNELIAAKVQEQLQHYHQQGQHSTTTEA